MPEGSTAFYNAITGHNLHKVKKTVAVFSFVCVYTTDDPKYGM